MILKQYWAHSGYDAEELYFEKINRDLVNRIKAEKGKHPKAPGNENPDAKEAPAIPLVTRIPQKKAA